MGSLMPGWQTTPLDARQIFKRSTSSLTNEEVKRFWRAKQNTIRRHLQEASLATLSSSDGSELDYSSLPSTPTSMGRTSGVPSSFEKADWWTTSNWAFLNQPPLSDTKQSQYTAQFDVARLERHRVVPAAIIRSRG